MRCFEHETDVFEAWRAPIIIILDCIR